MGVAVQHIIIVERERTENRNSPQHEAYRGNDKKIKYGKAEQLLLQCVNAWHVGLLSWYFHNMICAKLTTEMTGRHDQSHIHLRRAS